MKLSKSHEWQSYGLNTSLIYGQSDTLIFQQLVGQLHWRIRDDLTIKLVMPFDWKFYRPLNGNLEEDLYTHLDIPI